MQIQLQVNNEVHVVDAEADEPLLWVLRDSCDIAGPKFGCGAALCGACTVLVDGVAVRACVYPAVEAVGKEVTTIEGLATGDSLHPLQEAWIAESVPQCGYCQCGQIMTAAALLNKVAKPTEEQIELAMSGNLCRCGTYPRIVKAIFRATGRTYG